jgi:hypothetical protein
MATRPDKAPPSFPLYYKDAYGAAPESRRGRIRPLGTLLSRRSQGSRWRTITATDQDYPPFAGVYVFLIDNKPAYIGSSKNLRFRLREYQVRLSFLGDSIITPWGTHTNVSLKVKFSRRKGEWLFDEYRLIDRLRPTHNKSGVRRCQ